MFWRKKKLHPPRVVWKTEFMTVYDNNGWIEMKLTQLGESLIPKFSELSPKTQEKLRNLGIYK